MTRDDVIRLAREAGISDTYFDFQMVSPEDLERFAALVAAAEREACAEIADEYDYQLVAGSCARDIRARGKHGCSTP